MSGFKGHLRKFKANLPADIAASAQKGPSELTKQIRAAVAAQNASERQEFDAGVGTVRRRGQS